jgi:hypothetical protein
MEAEELQINTRSRVYDTLVGILTGTNSVGATASILI